MYKKELLEEYKEKKESIASRLNQFNKLKKEDYYNEFIFCILTPQSNAKKCWEAVEQLLKLEKFEEKEVNTVLKSKTRFHNNKTKYILESKDAFQNILPNLDNLDRKILRNKISETTKGYGLKEASHFLRNIGKSNNQIAILDRHILRNLKSLSLIEDEKIKSKEDYMKKEEIFVNYAKSLNISPDELDLLLWSRENGEIFK